MTQDLMLNIVQQLPSSVTPLHLEAGEKVPKMLGPMQPHEEPHSLQGPLQIDGATKKHYQGQERYAKKFAKWDNLVRR